jgi:hypothetical protein
MKRLTGLLTMTTLLCCIACGAAAQEPQNRPEVIADPSAGDWIVDRFAGNSTAGPKFFQGPAREVGGLGRPGACPLPDGRVLVPFRDGLAEIDREGTLRLVAPGRFIFGTTGQVTAHVMAYNPRDGHVYAAGPNCIRRIIEKPDGPWRSEVVAGMPSSKGSADGPAKEATFGRIDSILINNRGTIFVLDDNRRIRQIENGTVTTLNATVSAGPKPMDGPLKEARFHMIGLGGNLCLADDDTLYLSDHWNFVVRKIDLKTQTVSTVAGMPKPTGNTAREKRYNRNSDGPALTWASFNSGCAYVCWDPVHQALWCGGPDENRFRWLKDGEIRTVIGAEAGSRWDPDGLQAPAGSVRMSWNAVVAVDQQGRAYLSCSQLPHGLWRAYPQKENK